MCRTTAGDLLLRMNCSMNTHNDMNAVFRRRTCAYEPIASYAKTQIRKRDTTQNQVLFFCFFL